MGDKVAFLEKSEICEGNFVFSGSGSSLSPKNILSRLINSESELRVFCETYRIGKSTDHIFSLAVDAHAFLTQKIRPKEIAIARKRSATEHSTTIQAKNPRQEIFPESMSAVNTECVGGIPFLMSETPSDVRIDQQKEGSATYADVKIESDEAIEIIAKR